ncbi:hypothetical protein GJ496_001737 [Pomphorhynchus laevis]|nr:hypothetical protein GJ496_001737 [Pomphorhynchus laevis]
MVAKQNSYTVNLYDIHQCYYFHNSHKPVGTRVALMLFIAFILINLKRIGGDSECSGRHLNVYFVVTSPNCLNIHTTDRNVFSLNTGKERHNIANNIRIAFSICNPSVRPEQITTKWLRLAPTDNKTVITRILNFLSEDRLIELSDAYNRHNQPDPVIFDLTMLRHVLQQIKQVNEYDKVSGLIRSNIVIYLASSIPELFISCSYHYNRKSCTPLAYTLVPTSLKSLMDNVKSKSIVKSSFEDEETYLTCFNEIKQNQNLPCSEIVSANDIFTYKTEVMQISDEIKALSKTYLLLSYPTNRSLGFDIATEITQANPAVLREQLMQYYSTRVSHASHIIFKDNWTDSKHKLNICRLSGKNDHCTNDEQCAIGLLCAKMKCVPWFPDRKNVEAIRAVLLSVVICVCATMLAVYAWALRRHLRNVRKQRKEFILK